MDERTIPVEIYTEVIIEKRKKTVLEEQKYLVRVDFNEVTTKPGDLLSDLNIPVYSDTERFRGKERYFTTGSSDTSRPISDKGETIPIFLETVFKKLFLEPDELEKRDGIRYTRDGLPEPYNSERIPPEMRIKELWKALAKDPPVKAHCVARALQLLNLSAIRGTETKEAFSSICRVKFPYAKDGSLPPAGSPITQEYGILSLAMLFVDKLVAGSPQITQTDKYKEFRKRFKFFFERYEESAQDTIEAPNKLSDIDEKIMPGLCQGHTKDRIIVDNNMVYELQKKARTLLDRQAYHVRSCMAILFKLFNEQAVRSGQFEISAYVQENGTEAVNQLAEETRNMLVEYYGDCEQTYKEGMFLLYNKYKQDPGSIKYNQVDT
jgi:ribosomal protein S17